MEFSSTLSHFKDCVVGLNSPFPWAPGHAYGELELMCYKKLEGQDSRPYLYPCLEGPIASALQTAFSESLNSINITVITNPTEIREALLSAEHLDISQSSIKYVKRSDISELHYRLGPGNDLYVQLTNGENNFRSLLGSNQSLQTDSADYVNYYLENGDFFIQTRNALKGKTQLPPKLLKYIETKNKLVLINIREHKANCSAGMPAASFEGIASYCRDNNYAVVDMSHEAKSHEVLRFCKEYDVFPYWSLPEKSAAMDIELFTRASFYLGGGGPSHLAIMFRVPMLWIGNLYPIQIMAYNSYQLPCRLISKKNNYSLDFSDMFEVYLKRPELWEDKYDSWLKKYGPFNYNNCIDEISHFYIVERPNSWSILTSFLELEHNIEKKISDYNIFTSQSRDLLGRRFRTLDRPSAWNL